MAVGQAGALATADLTTGGGRIRSHWSVDAGSSRRRTRGRIRDGSGGIRRSRDVATICRENSTVWTDRLGNSSGRHENSKAKNDYKKLHEASPYNHFSGRATTLPSGTATREQRSQPPGAFQGWKGVPEITAAGRTGQLALPARCFRRPSNPTPTIPGAPISIHN